MKKHLEKWGIFTTKGELNKMLKAVNDKGLDVFEVRALTFVEKLTYVKDAITFVNEPHIIMFKATDEEYNSLIEELRLDPVF